MSRFESGSPARPQSHVVPLSAAEMNRVTQNGRVATWDPPRTDRRPREEDDGPELPRWAVRRWREWSGGALLLLVFVAAKARGWWALPGGIGVGGLIVGLEVRRLRRMTRPIRISVSPPSPMPQPEEPGVDEGDIIAVQPQASRQTDER